MTPFLKCKYLNCICFGGIIIRMKIVLTCIFTLTISYFQNESFEKTKNLHVLNGNDYQKDDLNNQNNRSWIYFGTHYSYFYNLVENIGNNDETRATCGYVALAMLLGYYDCYLSETIVPEKYEE